MQNSTKTLLSKVPEITIYFWIIKILCTTVGETAADYLNMTLGFGLTNTTYVMGAILIAFLVAQFRMKKYNPSTYWMVVVLLSVVGTLITDNLSDNLGVPLVASTIGFSIALAITFFIWYKSEKTLSIHSIRTSRRESFYWLAILFTFALGTAGGDLVAEQFAIGYFPSALIFAGIIATIAFAHYKFKLNAVLAFWLAYILTRPLGASIGDFMSQATSDGGLNLGTIGTSAIFLTAIACLVMYISYSKVDSPKLLKPVAITADEEDGVV
ncbi:MAG: putative rane-anchored protein [Candidatus Saccharibacteria bacterium]|nr:putative rane-anchored protein [Candidatus Saccharibacteria bacterium]